MIYTEEDALEDLKGFSKRNPTEFGITVDKLNKHNYVTNLDGADLRVEIAEYWSKDCSDYMRECGYKGRELWAFPKYYGENTPGGNYKEHSEFLYILFDSELYEYDKDQSMKEAEKDLDSEFDDWLKKQIR